VAADLLAGGVLLRVDQRVAAVVGRWDLRDGGAYPLLWLATQLGGRGFLAAVLLATAIRTGWRRRTLRPLLQALTALALVGGVVCAVKYGMGRTAPAFPGSYFHRGGASFPSGHAANAVVLWGVLRWQAVSYGLRARWQWLTAALGAAGPAVVGLAMVVLDFHWLSDAVAGATLGVVLLGVVRALDAVVLSLYVRARAGRPSA
jgi:membrane-associated phospholipid phosphatase